MRVPAERSIIHLNVADFAVAVERVLDRRLRGRPVVIALDGLPRAAVFDMSEEAYRAGVRKGMRLDRARRLCRDGLVIPPRLERYEQAMRSLWKLAAPYTPLVELVDENGHLFLDVSGTGRLFGPPPDIAWRIRKAVRSELDFDPIWSVAANKLVAKTATRLVKPRGEYIVETGDEEAFLRPLPLALLPGLEREELLRLREFHLRLVGEAARLTREQWAVIAGSPDRARFLHEMVRGRDEAPVRAAGESAPCVQADHHFGVTAGPAALGREGDTNDREILRTALRRTVERAGLELRDRQRAARRVGLLLDYSDGVRLARSAQADPPAADDLRLFSAAWTAFERAWMRRVRIRSFRLTCDRLVTPAAQLELFPEEAEAARRAERLQAAVDAVRRKFGAQALRFGRVAAAGA